MNSIKIETAETVDSQATDGSNLMQLAHAYINENPAEPSVSIDRLGLALGHFFMALLPHASQQAVLTVTGFCLTQLALERLQENVQSGSAIQKKAKLKGGR